MATPPPALPASLKMRAGIVRGEMITPKLREEEEEDETEEDVARRNSKTVPPR